MELPGRKCHSSEANVIYLQESSRKIEKSALAGYSFWLGLKTRRVTSSSSIFNVAKGSSRRQPYSRWDSMERVRGFKQGDDPRSGEKAVRRRNLTQVLLHTQQ